MLVPFELIEWSNDDWVSDCISQSGLNLISVLDKDVNLKLTSTGSTLLHLAAMCAHRPSVKSAIRAIKLLLEIGADPNSKDIMVEHLLQT